MEIKKILIAFTLFIVFASGAQAQQQDVQTIIEEGVALHGEGEFRRAIERYHEALRLDPDNILAIYEISLSYLALNKYENAIKYSTRVIESNHPTLSIGAYAIKSEALSALDRDDEALWLLQNAVRRHEYKYLLQFNLALKLYERGNIDDALVHIRRALELDKTHSSAFLLYAYILNDKELWVHSILAFQMFLLLEPDSRRSRAVFEELLQTMRIDIFDEEEEVERPAIQQQTARTQLNTATVSPDEVPPLCTVDGINRFVVYTTIIRALDSLKAVSESDDLFTVFKTVNRAIIKELDRQNDGSRERISRFWTFFVPFFSHIVHSEHYETFCRYISVSYIAESFEWWHENTEYAEDFVNWFVEGGKEANILYESFDYEHFNIFRDAGNLEDYVDDYNYSDDLSIDEHIDNFFRQRDSLLEFDSDNNIDSETSSRFGLGDDFEFYFDVDFSKVQDDNNQNQFADVQENRLSFFNRLNFLNPLNWFNRQ